MRPRSATLTALLLAALATPSAAFAVDGDGDGHDASVDCDDGDPDVFPGAVERCNGVDDNCDGDVDEAASVDALTWYADTDSDGFGTPLFQVTACEQPSGYVSDNSDCNDDEATVNPEETEVCDTLDNDCDGYTDEDGAADAVTWHPDHDLDGYGEYEGVTVRACEQPSGYAANNLDCDDFHNTIYPGAPEDCSNGVDDDCDGDADEAEDCAADTGAGVPKTCSVTGASPATLALPLVLLGLARRRRQA